ncbi:hypothetical protein T08_14169, partial [Trichinella sp. T8]
LFAVAQRALACLSEISRLRFLWISPDTDRANEVFPAENEDEDTEATV